MQICVETFDAIGLSNVPIIDEGKNRYRCSGNLRRMNCIFANLLAAFSSRTSMVITAKMRMKYLHGKVPYSTHAYDRGVALIYAQISIASAR